MRKTRSVDKIPFLAPDTVTKVIPAPTDGWDAISPLAEMDPKRAPILQNWVPRPGYDELRGGYQAFNNVATAEPVETLMVYRGASGEQMFAASGTKIFNVSVSGVSTPVVTGLSSDRWQYVNFTSNESVKVLQCCNGVDPIQQYDGTTWTEPSISGWPSGFSGNNAINISAQKTLLWYILNESTQVSFMPTGAIQGTLAGTLDFGPLWTKGGYLVAMGDWTIDGGAGPQDYVAFVSSRGQITLYQGTDPTNANAWSVVGTFNIAPPIGRRCFLPIGSDLAIITQQGVIPISQVLPFDPSADRSVAITARIQNAMAQAWQTAGNNFGWQMISFPDQQLAILNVPLVTNSQAQQFVMNALTGAWCQFLGWNANCFEIYNDNLYWGGNKGDVNQGYIGGTDNGTSIAADMQCAFNWLDEPGRVKRMTMVQPLLTLGGGLTPTLAIDTDFMTSTATAPVSTLAGGSLWDSAIWDQSVWSQLSVNFIQWLSVDALGHAMAIRMRVNIQDAGILFAGVFDIGTFDNARFDSGFSTTLPILFVNAFNTISENGGAI